MMRGCLHQRVNDQDRGISASEVVLEKEMCTCLKVGDVKGGNDGGAVFLFV